MSDSFTIPDYLLARARVMRRLGRLANARRLVRRVLGQAGLDTPRRAEASRLLGQIEFAAGRFRQARRMLMAAIRLRRYAGELYVEYARAVEADTDADPWLAVVGLRRAAALDPFEPRTWAALGTAAIRAGLPELARKAFRRAERLRPDRIDTLAETVDGLLNLGREDDACRVLTAARFRAPHDAAVAGLWNSFRYRVALRTQKAGDPGEEPTILRLPTTTTDSRGEHPLPVVLRADSQSANRPHLFRLSGRKPDPRWAQ